MDELIGILINVLVDLFRGKTPTPPANQTPPARPGSRPPLQQMPPRRQVPQRPARQVIRTPAAVTQRIDRPPLRPAPVMPSVDDVKSIVTPAPPPPSVEHRSVAVDAAALRRWLKPQILHNQFMLSEIFQPPLALREPSGR